jgi:hypothetical protein
LRKRNVPCSINVDLASLNSWRYPVSALPVCTSNGPICIRNIGRRFPDVRTSYKGLCHNGRRQGCDADCGQDHFQARFHHKPHSYKSLVSLRPVRRLALCSALTTAQLGKRLRG